MRHRSQGHPHRLYEPHGGHQDNSPRGVHRGAAGPGSVSPSALVSPSSPLPALLPYTTPNALLHPTSPSTLLQPTLHSFPLPEVPPEEEFDPMDPIVTHALVFDGDQPVATGRLLEDGHIGMYPAVPARRCATAMEDRPLVLCGDLLLDVL